MIINSILDNDLYKFTTSYAYMKLYPHAIGTFEFVDRNNTEYTKEQLQQIGMEITHMDSLKLTEEERKFMIDSCYYIPPCYFEWLSGYKYDRKEVNIWLDENNHLHIKATGLLYRITLWEVPILAIVSEVANGNIQARLRMMFLYNLASIHKGLVISTDNQTEYQLGFWTIHGDVGDFNPLFGLWKTEVYELAKWIEVMYGTMAEGADEATDMDDYLNKELAIYKSIALTPTDGLGISNSDLDQIGAKSYAEVDDILQTMLLYKNPEREKWDILYSKYSEEVVNKVWNRHLASEFKRKNLPIVIERKLYV